MNRLRIYFCLSFLCLIGINIHVSAQNIPLSVQAGMIKTINQTYHKEEAIILTNPLFKATFSPKGVFMSPRKNQMNWQWSLFSINGERMPFVVPQIIESQHKKHIDFKRGHITERYLLHERTIEQVFVIDSLPEQSDLCIEGEIQTEALFKQNADSWKWSNKKGVVTLGQLFVFDAFGKSIPADFEVNAHSTQIFIAQSDLANANFPITIDPEIGANDFRISDMGPNGNFEYDAFDPSVAYNSTDNEYLVVWEGEGGINSEFEIFGQRLASDGSEIGVNDFQISDMGPNGNTNYAAQEPFVVYNSTDNEYLVIWIGDDDTAPLVNDEFEVFGQRLANDGTEIGTNDFRISDMGPDGNTAYGAFILEPTVAYNSNNNEYLVVWTGDDDTAPLVDNEFEIFGQRLANDGTELGTNDFRISDMGPNGDGAYRAFYPGVVANPVFNNYLVVWMGEDDTAPIAPNEFEIFGQRISGAGSEIGTNDFRISDMGDLGDDDYVASSPSVTYNTTNHEYFVVWHGDDNIAPLVKGEIEIFGQRLSVVGTEVGDNDFRISDMGPNGASNDHRAFTPFVTYNATDNEYMVVWRGEDVMDNYQIYGQRLSNAGVEIGDNDFQLSDMGYIANIYPVVAFNKTDNEYLSVWYGQDSIAPLALGEDEIFGQLYSAAVLPVEFINFSARWENDNVLLQWETALENNNLGFEIERSLDGHFFEKIGWRDGHGNIQSIQQYTFVDKEVRKGLNYYYRLKQIDFGNHFSYSKIVAVQIPNENNISIFPNPFQNTLYIQTDAFSPPFDLTIHNQAGHILHSEMVEDNESSIQIAHFSTGIYFISIWKERQLVFQERIVKE